MSAGHKLIEDLLVEGYTPLLVYGVKMPETFPGQASYRVIFPTAVMKLIAAMPDALEPLLREIAVLKELALKPPDDQQRDPSIDVTFKQV